MSSESYNIADLREIARRRLPKGIFEFVERGTEEEVWSRARAAGFEGLLVTVDSPVPPSREYNLRNGFTLPFSLTRRNTVDILTHPRWLATVLMRYLVTSGMPRYENYPAEMKQKITALPIGRSMMLNDSLTWNDLRELRKRWPYRLMAKGILTAADAKLAADCGADAVIVSNHGGRVVDGTRAPVEALPEIVEAVGKRVEVIVDSGFRRGTDIVKARALGARAVLIGRATLYGTAAGGEAGAARAIALLRGEIDRTLALLGCSSVHDLKLDHLLLPESMQ